MAEGQFFVAKCGQLVEVRDAQYGPLGSGWEKVEELRSFQSWTLAFAAAEKYATEHSLRCVSRV